MNEKQQTAMTPKEKSQQLINDFYGTTYNSSNDYDERHRIAKQCALISVNEILSVVDYPCEQYNYYLEVKQEIEKL